MQHIRINQPTVGGVAEVTVDGIDISDRVSRVTFDLESSAPRVARVYVEGFGSGTIEVEGVVVQRITDVTAVREFLAGVDTEKLEQEALTGLGLEGGASTVGEAIILKLMEWASGDHDGT